MIGNHAAAQSVSRADSLFQQANRLYEKGQYAEALDTYRQVEETGYESPELYYNMGNAAYKLNRKALSIGYYNKALYLRPDFQAAKNNLRLMQRSLTDRIQPVPVPFYLKLRNRWVGLASTGTWALWSLVGIWLAFAVALLYLFASRPALKRISFLLIWLFLLIGSVSYMSYRVARTNREKQTGVVAVPQAELYEQPGQENGKNSVLHEGTLVEITGQQGDWYKVKTADGNTFWLQKTNIFKIH